MNIFKAFRNNSGLENSVNDVKNTVIKEPVKNDLHSFFHCSFLKNKVDRTILYTVSVKVDLNENKIIENVFRIFYSNDDTDYPITFNTYSDFKAYCDENEFRIYNS